MYHIRNAQKKHLALEHVLEMNISSYFVSTLVNSKINFKEISNNL